MPASLRHKRVHWVALRTLRQVPRIVGETEAGDPIVEIRSVRLVLQGNAAHFRRLQVCSKCGKDAAGATVLDPVDLDRSPESLICQDCLRTGAGEQALDIRVERPLSELGVEAERFEALERRVEELQGSVDANEVQTSGATASVPSNTDLVRIEEQTNQRLDRLAEGIGRLDALERRIEEAESRVSGHAEAQQTALRAEFETRLDELRAAQELGTGQMGASVEQATSGYDDLSRAMTDQRGQLEELAERLQKLQKAMNAQTSQVQATATALTETRQELERQSERVAQRGESESERLQALEAEVRAAVSGLTEQVESQGRSLQSAVTKGLAEVQAAAAEAAAAMDPGRLQRLEEAAARREAELEELFDLHAALDAGMGELRSGIVAGRAADTRTSDALDEIYRRIEALSTAHETGKADQGRGRRSGRKSAESTTDIAAALAEVDPRVREQRQLREQVVSLQQDVDSMATAAARVASQVAPLASLRTEVRALQSQLAEQEAAIESLATSVESRRRRTPSPAAGTAKKPPRTTKE